MKNILLLFLLPLCVNGQNTIGLPDIINYNKEAYNGGLQNWDLRQDNNGVLYIANNEGLLSFDGTFWNLHPLPNKTIVHSVEIGEDSKIYVGGQGEIGFFAAGQNGTLQYQSLTQLIPEKDRVFEDVWDIVSFNRNIYFRCNYKIYKLSGRAISVYTAPFEWTYLGVANGQLYAHDFRAGILHYQDDIWKPATVRSDLPTNDPVTSLLTLNKDSVAITTLKSGVYFLAGGAINKLASVHNPFFEENRIYAASMVNNEWIALATSNNGVCIINSRGNIIQRFSKNEGLQNNNVLSIFLDQQHNLWLGLDNGIDFIAYNSAVKHITPNFQNSSGYTAIIHNNILYAGTSNGLYSVPLQPEKDLSFSQGNFSPVQNANGQAWSLSEINDQVLLGRHEGAFIVKNNQAIPINSQTGFWNFTPTSGIYPTSQIIAGNYKGLTYFNYEKGSFAPGESIPNFTESSRFVCIDANGNTWVSHPYHGVFKISKQPNGSFTIASYTAKNGLPSTLENHIYKIKNEMLVATEKGIYQYDAASNSFKPSDYYKKIFGDQSLRYLKEDPSGNIWFIHDKTLGVVDFSGKEPSIIYINEVKEKMLSGFEFIYPVDLNNIFLGGETGFFHINYEKYKQLKPALKIQIRTVSIRDEADSLLFGGYFNSVNETQSQLAENEPSIGYNWKTIRFNFSSPLFGYQSNLEYSYQLEGFDRTWSDWTKRTDKEYTNLSAGRYTFKVKVRNNLGNESNIASYSFKVLPPWYQTRWAYLIYLLLFCGVVYLAYHWQRKKFKLQQYKHEEEQKKLLYIHDLEKSKVESDLMNLKNEKLESEINFKNSELASSGMHLVKKGELLTKIKGELIQLQKNIDSNYAREEIKKMMKSLNDDENLDQEWENFSKHFDKVHSNFLITLKEKHPDITSNEHKLCAYLRMNLSTKEIAQLMNISVRGVEISRYRLRKKLGIPSELNLFDYLISFNNSEG
jgi:DNA-binding CsgD family transcriptional regulator